ncbi:MAG: substrate-binding domain-containing protein [Chitinophagaceae bacterium]|jgi:phosphate transport system substrate-binding protein|nr:substrate-binding domain-containing protein [Chitinophagaceae bacterium]
MNIAHGRCIENKIILTFSLLFFLLMACKNDGKKKIEYDSPKKGTIRISVDESFQPVISEQIKVYESLFPETHILAEYKPEADCFRDLQKDSTRMIVVAHKLSDKELEIYKNNLYYYPHQDIIAYDAISVVVNPASADSSFTINELKKLLSDSSATGYQMIMDGNNATSTVKYLLDSIMNGTIFGKNVKAAKGSMAVINYVSENPKAIGFVGSSWTSDEDDPQQMAYMKKVKLALIECKPCGKDTYTRPSQNTMMNGEYVLVRPLYCILKENSLMLGSAFFNFMRYEKGQLIFRRAGLVPGKMDFTIRSGSLE